MSLNRRQFLAKAALAASASTLLRPLLFAQSQAPVAWQGPRIPPTEFVPLRGGTGYFIGRGGTIGWYSGKNALAAIDTQFVETARIFLEQMPGRAGRTLNVVCNTHHHSDHTGGNPVMKPASRLLVAQRRVPLLQLRNAERFHTTPLQVFADTLFDTEWQLDLGDEHLTAKHFGPAHTAGDAVFHFEKANVVHMGDLVFNRLYPVIDPNGGYSVRGWVDSLDRVIREYPADAIYLFGHGNARFGVAGSRSDLSLMRDYFTVLIAYVEKGIAAGNTREELAEGLPNMPGFDDFHVPPGRGNRLPDNIRSTYDELTRLKGV